MTDTVEPNITIVTAFFDIGRQHWQVFARKTETYLDWFANLATLANPMVVYTSPEFADRITAIRHAAGHADLTTVVTIEDFRATNPAMREAIVDIQQRQEFQEFVADRNLPKWWHPDYLLLGHLKPAFVNHAIEAGLVRTPLAAWVDFAACRSPRAVEGVAAWSYPFDPARAHVFTRFAFDPAVPAELIVKHGDPPISADAIVAGPGAWRELAAAWADRLERLVEQGLIDEAGALLMMTWQQRPDLIDLHDLSADGGNPWLPAFRHFNEPVEWALPEPQPRQAADMDRDEDLASATDGSPGAGADGSDQALLQRGMDLEEAERWDEAIAAYEACFEAAESSALAGWAAYRTATVLGARQGRWEAAEAVCREGIAVDPTRPDLHWLAGYAAYQQDEPERAVAWARVAVALNHAADVGTIPEHPGPLHEPARWDAPWDLLRYVLADLGDDDGARFAADRMVEAPYRRSIVARRDESAAGEGRLASLGVRLRRAEADAHVGAVS